MRALRFASLRATLAVAIASLALLPACSVIVSSEGPLRCETGAEDPCPVDFRCLRNECIPVPCDLDSDGWGCGGTVDCADNDPDVHPTAPETCDGVDSDCDGAENATCPMGQACGRRGQDSMCLSVADCLAGRSVCNAQQRCDASSGECVPRTATDCRTVGCNASQVCDTLTGVCITPAALGASCGRDIECGTGICFPAASLELGAVGGVCAKPCCSDGDCEDVAGTCLATGTGVRGCVPRVARAPACARDSECSATCRLDASRMFSCTATLSVGAFAGDPCTADDDCYSGYCLDETCAEPCAFTEDCTDEALVCRYYSTTPVLPRATWVTLCRPPQGRGANGTRCALDAECQEKYCHNPPTGSCSAVCCSDDQCGMGLVCRPVQHNGWELRCIRP